MSIIAPEFISSNVAIGIDQLNGDRLWIGSGFIVSRKETEEPSKMTCYLITNKHVVHGITSAYLRFNSTSGQLIKDYAITFASPDGTKLYSEHPNPNTDVVALQITPQALIDDCSIWGAIDLEEQALTLDQMQQQGIDEGNLVYALGFPMNLVSSIKVPICRLGCISRITDAFILKSNFPIFLVDAPTYPGNSGGPVLFRPENTYSVSPTEKTGVKLIGILSSYIPYNDTLISQQTKQPVMIQQENSGLTVVHPVDRIKETVEEEWKRMSGKT